MEVVAKKVIEIVKSAGKLFEKPSNIAAKGPNDFVTEVDSKVQNYIYQQLKYYYPDIQFLGEESANHDVDLTQLCWVLDPVDGTTNLIHDYHFSAISLALYQNNQPIMAFVYQPYLKEMFHAIINQGAYLNNQRIFVSLETKLENSLIAIGTSPYYTNEADDNFEMFKQIFKHCTDIRRSGSAALDLAWCACGRQEAYLEKNLKIWDYGAGMLLVQEAGGILLNYEGKSVSNQLVSHIVAGNAAIVNELINNFTTKKKS